MEETNLSASNESLVTGNQNSLIISGLLLAIAGSLMFSSKPILVKLAYEYETTTLTLLALRMGFSLPFYLVIGLWALKKEPKKKFSTKDIVLAAIVGILGHYLAAYLDLEALKYISTQLERLIVFAYPTIVVILNWIIFKQRMSLPMAGALLMTYIGIWMLFGYEMSHLGDNIALGGLLAFGASLSFAVCMVFSAPIIEKMGSRIYTSIALSASALAALIHFLLGANISDLIQPLQVYAIALAIAFVATVIPTFLIAEALARIDSGRVAIATTIGPAATAVMAVFILGELFTVTHAISLCLTSLGVLWLSLKRG